MHDRLIGSARIHFLRAAPARISLNPIPTSTWQSGGERIMSLLVRLCASTADRQPSRTYYQVLDISPHEQDPKVIEEAVSRCYRHVRAYQLTRESECTPRLNEIAQALITLRDPVRRREYDLSLAKPLSPELPDAGRLVNETLLSCRRTRVRRPPRARTMREFPGHEHEVPPKCQRRARMSSCGSLLIGELVASSSCTGGSSMPN